MSCAVCTEKEAVSACSKCQANICVSKKCWNAKKKTCSACLADAMPDKRHFYTVHYTARLRNSPKGSMANLFKIGDVVAGKKSHASRARTYATHNPTARYTEFALHGKKSVINLPGKKLENLLRRSPHAKTVNQQQGIETEWMCITDDRLWDYLTLEMPKTPIKTTAELEKFWRRAKGIKHKSSANDTSDFQQWIKSEI